VEGSDPFNLGRFVDAQAGGVYERALAELQSGEKRGHWIWFIFPQHRDLGRSDTAKFYGLSGPQEAAAYLNHPLLGPNCARAWRPLNGTSWPAGARRRSSANSTQ
jgi:uncharacterized protein (DUF1810 family)